MLAQLSLVRDTEGNTMVLHRRPVGRPQLSEADKKTVRLPSTYVTAEVEARFKEAAANANMEWSEFSRQALEFYIANKDNPALTQAPEAVSTSQAEEVVLVKLERSKYNALTDFAKNLVIMDLAAFFQHMAHRTLIANPHDFLRFFYGSVFDGEDEAVEEDRKTRESKRGSKIA